MAAPATPVSPWASVAFFDAAIDFVTMCSNMSIPHASYADQPGVISGTTASTIVAALLVQRGLL